MTKNVEKKKLTVQEALRQYNFNKTDATRKNVLDSKKDYKYFCRKEKHKYLFDRGRKMNEMRTKKPKEFGKFFKRKKPAPNHDISDNEFF